MNPLNFLAGGAALGFLAGCWDKVKAAAWKVANLFIDRVEISSESAHDALVAYLVAHYRHSRFYDRTYAADYEHFGIRTLIFWDGWRPFVFSNQQENRAAAHRPDGASTETHHRGTKIFSTLTFLRWTVDVEDIVRRACCERNRLTWDVEDEEEKSLSRFVIRYVPKIGNDDDEAENGVGFAWYHQSTYRLLAHKPAELGRVPNRQGKALDHLVFPQPVKDLIREIELWRVHKQWHVDRRIPWKRGWLLYGLPGTGKTALARAFAEDLNLPIYVYNLAELGNHELMRAWADMQINVPCIALIEDIDNVFHGRKNVAHRPGMSPILLAQPKKEGEEGERVRSGPLTFDCLLNCLDGVERSDGVFTIITTNDIEKVDPALGRPRKLPDGTVEFISTRPGRIDKAVELGYLEPGDKKLMARRILGDYPEEYAAVLEFIDRYPDLQETPAQFPERCGQIALACFWKDQQADIIKKRRAAALRASGAALARR